MNYYQKYLKYKKKYLNLKKTNMNGGFFEITTESSLASLTQMKNALATTESNDNFTNTDKTKVNQLVDQLKTYLCDTETSTTEPTMEPVMEPTMEPVAEPTLEPTDVNSSTPPISSDSPVMEGGYLLRGLLTENSLDLSSSDTISSTEI